MAFRSYASNLVPDDGNGWMSDIFLYDRQTGQMALISRNAGGSGNAGGIALAPADILRYTRSTNTWQMIDDGSVRGTPKNVAAFDETLWGGWLLVFGANQVIPGLGTATPRDIVPCTPNNRSSYPLGAGTYKWYLRGADIGLTTSAENIDALHVNYSDVYISTAGAAAVGPGGSIKAQ